jgi:hypothetical protein
MWPLQDTQRLVFDKPDSQTSQKEISDGASEYPDWAA